MKEKSMGVSVNVHNPKVIDRNLLDKGAVCVKLGNREAHYDGIYLFFDSVEALKEFALELKTEAIIAEALEQERN